MVMDGNAQWARARGLPSAAGHEAGRRSLEETVRLSRAWGIRALTAIAFSHENWSRPKVEVDFLMGLSERMIHDSVAEFLREEIRLRVIGDCSRLPVSLQKTAREAEAATKNNSQLDLTLAISYSGRRDIVQACGKLAQKVHSKLLRPEDIDESLFANELETSCENEFLYPDLLISEGEWLSPNRCRREYLHGAAIRFLDSASARPLTALRHLYSALRQAYAASCSSSG